MYNYEIYDIFHVPLIHILERVMLLERLVVFVDIYTVKQTISLIQSGLNWKTLQPAMVNRRFALLVDLVLYTVVDRFIDVFCRISMCKILI